MKQRLSVRPARALSLIFIFMASLASAKTSISLTDISKLALKNSSALEAQRLHSQSKASLSRQSGAWFNPEFSFEQEETKEAGGNSTTQSFGLSQRFSVPGKNSLKRNIADLEAAAAETEMQAFELNLKTQVLQAAYAYKAAQEYAKHALERTQRLNTVETFLKSRSFASPQKKIETHLVSSRLMVIQRDLENALIAEQVAWTQLNLFLQLPEPADIRLNWIQKSVPFDFKELTEKALAQNPELRIHQLESARAQAETSLAQKEFIPDFTLLAKTSQYRGFRDDRVWGLGVSFPLPVFDTNKYAIEAANLRSRSVEQKFTAEKLNHQSEMQTLVTVFQSRQKLVEKIPVTKIDELEKQIRYADLEFKKGRLDLLTYLETDSEHASTVGIILEAQTDYIASLCSIVRATNDESLLQGLMVGGNL